MLKRAIAGKTIEEYCLWLQHNEMSQGTIYKYRYYLNQLEQFMDGAALNQTRGSTGGSYQREGHDLEGNT